MRTCRGCPARVPIVSTGLAQAVAGRVPPLARQGILDRAIGWLTDHHPGLTLTEGIVGRPYTVAERVAIAGDLWAVERTPCPFATHLGCCLGGLTDDAGWARDARRTDLRWLPSALVRIWDNGVLQSLARAHLIADAKLAGLTRHGDFPMPRWSSNQPYLGRSLYETEKEVSTRGPSISAGTH